MRQPQTSILRPNAPEQKDSPDGADYRINLITVPSCDEHNSAKSSHDEYLLYVLTGSYSSSGLGLAHFSSKVRRAFERAPSNASNFVRRSEPILIKRHADDEWEDGAQIVVEADHLDLVLGNCARALYFHETAQKFSGPIRVATAFTMYTQPEVQAKITSGVAAAKSYFDTYSARGANPKVFWYKFEEGKNTAIFFMCFYSGSEVLVQLHKRDLPIALAD